MLIGVVVLSFDAGDMASPLCVMEGRNKERQVLVGNAPIKLKGRRKATPRQHVFSSGTLLLPHSIDQECGRPHSVPYSEPQIAGLTQGNRGG